MCAVYKLKIFLLIFLISLFFTFYGCSSALNSVQTRNDFQNENTNVQMDPIKIVAKKNQNGKVELFSYDEKQLFDIGNKYLINGDYEAAIKNYSKIIDEFSVNTKNENSDQSYIFASKFNIAYCFMLQNKFEDAAQSFLDLIAEFPEHSNNKEALFIAGDCLEKNEHWDKSQSIWNKIILSYNLTPLDKMEALTRLGVSLIKTKDLNKGQDFLRKAISFFRSKTETDIPTDYYIGEAYFYIGEINRELLISIPLGLDEEELREELEKKSEYLIKGQIAYVQSIRTRNPYWATASGFRAGEIYALLYYGILNAPLPLPPPLPDDLTQDERENFIKEFYDIYNHELEARTRPLIKKSVSIWEKTILMTERIGIDNEWVTKTREQLEKARDILYPPPPENEETPPEKLPTPHDLQTPIEPVG